MDFKLGHYLAESLIDTTGKPNPPSPEIFLQSRERKMKMSALKADALAREFHYNGFAFPIPGRTLPWNRSVTC